MNIIKNILLIAVLGFVPCVSAMETLSKAGTRFVSTPKEMHKLVKPIIKEHPYKAVLLGSIMSTATVYSVGDMVNSYNKQDSGAVGYYAACTFFAALTTTYLLYHALSDDNEQGFEQNNVKIVPGGVEFTL